MIFWLVIFFGIFSGLLILAAFKSYKKNRSAKEIILAGSSIGAILGFLTFAAAFQRLNFSISINRGITVYFNGNIVNDKRVESGNVIALHTEDSAL